MELLVKSYLTKLGTEDEVDWDFVFDRTMKEKVVWGTDDAMRHKLAWANLLATGYIPLKKLKAET